MIVYAHILFLSVLTVLALSACAVMIMLVYAAMKGRP